MIGNKEELIELYRKYTMVEIAKKYGCTKQTIWKWFKKYKIKSRKMIGKNHGSWKGGKVLKNGYPAIWNPKHHRTNNVGYVKEHILIMEKKLGRKISKEEHVHHIDFTRDNNNPKNLWVCSPSNHKIAERSIQKLVKELIEKRIIKFNRRKRIYEL